MQPMHMSVKAYVCNSCLFLLSQQLSLLMLARVAAHSPYTWQWTSRCAYVCKRKNRPLL